jgi:hypothetical protein
MATNEVGTEIRDIVQKQKPRPQPNLNHVETFKECVHYIALLFILAIAIQTVITISPWFRDNSDKQGWFASRSGLRLHQDHLTGCQYIESNNGSLLKRTDSKGQHIGCHSYEVSE